MSVSPGAVPSTAPSWDSGVIRLTFSNSVPTFSVTSDKDSRVTATYALNEVVEVSPSGNITAVADFGGVNVTWMFSASVSPAGTVVWANASLPVVQGSGAWHSGDDAVESEDDYGKAHVSLAFYLNASDGINPTSLRFVVNLTKWPWVNATDALGVELGTTATGGTSLIAGMGPNQLTEIRNGTTTPVSTLTWNPVATVQLTGGVTSTSTVGTFRSIGGGGTNSTIQLEFGAVSGGYSELQYDPTVALNPGAFPLAALPAWLWSPASIAVIGLSIVLIGLLGAIATVARSRPTGIPEEP